MANLP